MSDMAELLVDVMAKAATLNEDEQAVYFQQMIIFGTMGIRGLREEEFVQGFLRAAMVDDQRLVIVQDNYEAQGLSASTVCDLRLVALKNAITYAECLGRDKIR